MPFMDTKYSRNKAKISQNDDLSKLQRNRYYTLKYLKNIQVDKTCQSYSYLKVSSTIMASNYVWYEKI